jgi:hypothetical protein
MAKAKETKPAEAPAPEQGTTQPARVCHEGDRATPGLKRFRVRCVGSTGTGGAARPVGLYVLAADRAAAEACYLDAEATELAALGFGAAAAPLLRTDELPD